MSILANKRLLRSLSALILGTIFTVVVLGSFGALFARGLFNEQPLSFFEQVLWLIVLVQIFPYASSFGPEFFDVFIAVKGLAIGIAVSFLFPKGFSFNSRWKAIAWWISTISIGLAFTLLITPQWMWILGEPHHLLPLVLIQLLIYVPILLIGLYIVSLKRLLGDESNPKEPTASECKLTDQ
jgi:hypothetical protein